MNFIKPLLSLFLFVVCLPLSQAQLDVVLGTNNEPITEIKFDYLGSTITQTAGVTSNTVATTPVALEYIEINGSTLLYPYDEGSVSKNNNYTANTNGVGVHLEGQLIDSGDPTFVGAFEDLANNADLMNFLYYDGSSNLPPAGDIDITFAKGFEADDYLAVGERNGNTYFTLTPIDEFGNIISGSTSVRFGFTPGTSSGNGTTRYDWDIGYSPTNQSSQSMIYSVVKADLFNIGSDAIFGFRIDNLGDADVKLMALSETDFADNPTNTQIAGLSGNVFNDFDGLMDATVDGTTINTPDGTQLYANLYDPVTGDVIATTPIAADGSYEFLDLAPNTDYAVSVSINEGTEGAALPAQELPAGWIYTGDTQGTTAGDDGTPDGMQTLISVAEVLEPEVNFGIEETPTSDTYSYAISDPAPNSTFTIGSDITSDLSGTDPEEGALGTGATFGITSLPTSGNTLMYNGVAITVGEDGINPPSATNPAIIPNYDPSLLEIVFDGVASQTQTEFEYVVYDEAMQASEPTTYTLQYASLPVEWEYFRVEKMGNKATIHFATAMEINTSHFEIEKSKDGIEFYPIADLEAQGLSTETVRYSFVDQNVKVGSNYYRVKQIDLNGAYSYTDIKMITGDLVADTKVYPNPVSAHSTMLNLQIESTNEQETIYIYNMLGLQVKELTLYTSKGSVETHQINIGNLETGNYVIKFSDRAESIVFTIVK